jgi:hypothetical protein
LHCVSDPAGLSYYGDERVGQDLHLSAAAVREARQGLIHRQMLLYRHPMYQLIDLPAASSGASPADRRREHNHAAIRPPKSGADAEAVSIGAVLRRCLTQAGGPR